MRKLIFSLLVSVFLLFSLEIQALPGNCQAPKGGPVLHSDDFSWNMTREQLLEKFDEIYSSGKRLDRRAYIKDGQWVLPMDVPSRGVVDMPLPEKFLKNVTLHIESALERGYAEAIIFPDMGHSHFFLPKDFYEREIRPLDINQKDLMYLKFFKNPNLKTLYHTAEQLRLLDDERRLLNDRHIQWRFYTRNVVGSNDGNAVVEVLHEPESSHNTARVYNESYRYWGAGYSISASKDGCFSYRHKGQTYFYDISLYDLTPSGGVF